jgi:hypothetical protein
MSKRTDSMEIDEVALLNRQADRMDRNGRPAMALLLRNAAWIAGGGDMSAYDWGTRKDGKTDDVSVTEVRR